MNVWVRVASCVDIESETTASLEVKAGLSLTVYTTRKLAEEAQQEVGGIVLEVNASCLLSQNEFGKRVLLTSDHINEDEGPSSAAIEVCYDGLPYKMVPNYGPYEPGTVDPQGDIAEFGPEADAWFNELEKEAGFEMHQ